MNHAKEALLNIAEECWPEVIMNSQVTPDSLLLNLTSHPNHKFDTLGLSEATDVVYSFLSEMEKQRCVKKHPNFTKRTPIYIKTSNVKRRAEYRQLCDILNSFSINYSFYSTEFVNIVAQIMTSKKDKKQLSSFLSRAVKQGYLLKRDIDNPIWQQDRVEYIKNSDIPEVEMGKLVANYNYRKKVIRTSEESIDKVKAVTPVSNGEMPTAYDVSTVIEKLKEKLVKAYEDCKNHAQREAEARAQASDYQKELNFLKRMSGFDKIDMSTVKKLL